MDYTRLLEVGIKHDLNFGVDAYSMDQFLSANPGNREKLANFLQSLSEKCGFGVYPFQTTKAEEHGPVDWS